MAVGNINVWGLSPAISPWREQWYCLMLGEVETFTKFTRWALGIPLATGTVLSILSERELSFKLRCVEGRTLENGWTWDKNKLPGATWTHPQRPSEARPAVAFHSSSTCQVFHRWNPETMAPMLQVFPKTWRQSPIRMGHFLANRRCFSFWIWWVEETYNIL